MTAASIAFVDAIDAALPQTQCTRCGEPDCRRYAEAIATGRAPINRCPPGGAEGIARLAALTGHAPQALDPAHGIEGPRRLAVIDEALCIGCTLCIKACPVDCIVGAPKQMHTVIEAQCTGCELCLPACPVDCIALVQADPAGAGRLAPTGWAAWSPTQALQAAARYRARNGRLDAERRALRVPTFASDANPAPQQDRAAPDAAQARKDRVANALAKAQRRRNA